MRHHFIGFAVLLSACSMSGQVLTGPDGGGADAGPSDGGSSDGGQVWRSCETLTADNHGEPCEGPFYCSGTCPCGGEEIRCVDGLAYRPFDLLSEIGHRVAAYYADSPGSKSSTHPRRVGVHRFAVEQLVSDRNDAGAHPWLGTQLLIPTSDLYDHR